MDTSAPADTSLSLHVAARTKQDGRGRVWPGSNADLCGHAALLGRALLLPLFLQTRGSVSERPSMPSMII